MSAIEERYRKLHPKSVRLYEEGKRVFPDGVTHDTRRVAPFPLYITHQSGARKWDVDGHEYVDYRGGHGALILGHSHPEVVKAVNEQMPKGTHPGFNHELEIRWAQWVQRLMPSAEKVRFHSSGTEATLMALRLARAYTNKTKIIKFVEHYHGWQDYVFAGLGRGMGGIPQQTLSTMVVLPDNDISILEKTLKEDKDIAGVILEVTGAHEGYRPVPASFLHELRDVTERYGVVLIFDEVVTGFRVSRGGAQVKYNVRPDLTSLAKILGGGLPGGAVAGKADILNMMQMGSDPAWNNTRRVAHYGTYNGNQLSAAAGCKTLELIATTLVNAKADAAAKRLRDGMNRLISKMEIPGCCSGVSSFVNLRLGFPHDCDKEVCMVSYEQMGKLRSSAAMRVLDQALLNEGVHAGGATVLVSSVHSNRDIDETLSAYEKALTSVRKEGLL